MFSLLFYALILFDRLGGDGGRGFALRGVVLLNVSCGSGDGSPSFATTDAESECAKHEHQQDR